MFNKKGNSYIEIMVVVAVLLIITLFAIPRYQTLRRDAFRAQVASDSRLVEAYVIEEYFHNRDMPIGSTLLSDDELKNLVTANRSYLRGNVLNSKDIDTLGGKKYKLNKKEVLKHINTQLTGDFVYTDKGVIYIDIISNKEDIDIEDLEKMIGPVKQVALGYYCSAAITKDGDLYTWGDNRYGQLGHGNEKSNDVYKDLLDGIIPIQTIPKKVNFFTDKNIKVKQVALGFAHAAAITENGDLYVWGNNESGKLGLGDSNIKNIDKPTKIDFPNNMKIKQISLEYCHSIALTENGDIYAWGDNGYGQLGLGDNNIKSIDKPTKVCFSNNTKVKQIAIGTDHSAALTENGDLYTWGGNSNGQLGHNGKNGIPTKVSFPNDVKIKNVDLGRYFSAALTENGDFYTWGRGIENQLGLGLDSKENKDTPTKIKLGDNIKIKNIVLGGYHAGFLTVEGELYIWGNENGGVRTKELQGTPTKVSDLPKLKQIDLSIYHSAALTENGHLYIWGDNRYGQLGLNDKGSRFEPIKLELFNEK